MKNKPKRKNSKANVISPIPATKLLRAESTRLDVLKHAMPDAAQDWISAQVWAYNLAAVFLESLGAPEKVQGYVPANESIPAKL